MLNKIGARYGVNILGKEEWFEGLHTVDPGVYQGIDRDLLRILRGTGLTFMNYRDYLVIIYIDKSNPGRYQDFSSGARTYLNRIYRFSGQVLADKDDEPVIGATIYIEELDTGTITDINGYFRLNIPSGKYSVAVKSVGFIDQEIDLELVENIDRIISLPNEIIQLKEVVISESGGDRNISETAMGLFRINMKSLQSQPAFMAETDVVRGLLLLPGVSSAGEAATGFNVRGGNTDQNLVLLDDAPVYNASHIFGMFSVFNQDVIREASLQHSGLSARYGGRVSSVLDVKTKNNIPNRFRGCGGIGLFASRLAFEMPIQKEKISLMAGGRISYSDYLLNYVPNKMISNSSAFFYDTNIKLNFRINKTNYIQYSFFNYFDRFKLPFDTLYDWGTMNHSVQYNRLIGEKMVINLSGSSARYDYGITGNGRRMEFNWAAGVHQEDVKADIYYAPGNIHTIELGGGMTWYTFLPGNLTGGENSAVLPVDLENERGREYFAYIGDELSIIKSLRVSAGLRYSNYGYLGPQTVYEYDPEVPRDEETITGSVSYARGKEIVVYDGWEPRLSMRWSFGNLSSAKASLSRMYQYMHLVSNSLAVSPVDLWKACDPYILPLRADQVSLGYFRNFNNNSIETSVEIYYKRMEGIVDYKDGAELFLNPYVDAGLLQGKGRAYGVELLFKKNAGRITGWASYTFSRTERKVSGQSFSETINGGKYYPSNYDKPNDLKLAVNYQVNRRWSLAGNFVYNTGKPATYPQSKYLVDNFVIANYGARNHQRIPDYHRLDFSVNLKGNHKKNKFWEGGWTFSVYNVYGRNNAYSIYFKPIAGSRLPQAYKYSLLGSAFPAITYNFNFL